MLTPAVCCQKAAWEEVVSVRLHHRVVSGVALDEEALDHQGDLGEEAWVPWTGGDSAGARRDDESLCRMVVRRLVMNFFRDVLWAAGGGCAEPLGGGFS